MATMTVPCEECGSNTKWIGTLRIGMGHGSIACYECNECKYVTSINIPPTKKELEQKAQFEKSFEIFKETGKLV